MKRQKQFIYFILIVAALIALMFYNPWLLYFQNDDLIHIPLSKQGIIFQHNSFRPICDLSIILDYNLYHKIATGYHFTNLILHLLNSILVFVIAKKFFKKYLHTNNINLVAFTTAVLFWVYMNHSESVFWILGRSAMLGFLFFLPAVFFYFERNNFISFCLCILFSALAWLSYESTLILPAIFFITSFADAKRNNASLKKEAKFLIIIASVFVLYCCCRFYFISANNSYYNVGANTNINLFFLAGSFLRLMIRSWLPPCQNKILLTVSFLLLMLLLLVLIIKLQNKNNKKVIGGLLIVWLISLLPYVMLSIDTKGVESERFLYLPSIFICIVIVILIAQYHSTLQLVITAIIFCINILVLNNHAAHYRFACEVVRTTMQTINQQKQKKILYVDSLPQESSGALIFRSGFKEGVRWLTNKGSVDSVVVLSYKATDLPLHKNYPVNFSSSAFLINNSMVKRFTTNDIYFLYTNSALLIIKKSN